MKKKAFTLTELLVVVVIIGTLAAVVLPKFTKVLETRRTTEAEDIMRAVRSEQEARCTLDRNYTIRPEALSSWPENTGNNYAYALKRGGITATRQGETAYTLNMAYGDGSICCEGDACNDLNKYSQCSASYISQVNGETQCAAPEAACDLYDHEELCGAGYTGTRRFTVNSDCSGYDETDNCELIPTSGCTEGTTRNVTPANCAHGSSGEKCVSGEWVAFTNNDTTPKPADTTETCSSGGERTCTYSCNNTSGAWEKTCGECTTGRCNGKQPSKGETYSELCDPNQPQGGSVYYTWNWETCEYDEDRQCSDGSCQPEHNGEEVWWVTSGCPNMQVGCTIYTWDYDSCEYKKSYDCKDKENARIWSNYKQLASYETGIGYCVSAANQYYANQAHTINTDENYARIKAFIASSNTKCPSGTRAGGKVPDTFTGDRCWTEFFANSGDQCPRCSPGVMTGPYTDESGGCVQTGSSSCEGSTTTTVCVMPYRYGVYFVVNQ